MDGGTMTIAALKAVVQRAEAWSDEDQQKLARAAELIEAQHAEGFALSEEDWKIIDDRAEAARNGDLATEREAAAFFEKYRRK